MMNYFHASPHTFNDQYLISNPYEKSRILKFYYDVSIKYNLESLAFCIMDNHFHLLFEFDYEKFSPNQKALYLKMAKNSNEPNVLYASFCLGILLRRYSKYYRENNDYTGQVFDFHRDKIKKISKSKDLLNVIEYIHSNPCKAGMCNFQHEYVYSSFPYYAHQLHQKSLVPDRFIQTMSINNLSLNEHFVERQFISKFIKFYRISHLYENRKMKNETLFLERHSKYISNLVRRPQQHIVEPSLQLLPTQPTLPTLPSLLLPEVYERFNFNPSVFSESIVNIINNARIYVKIRGDNVKFLIYLDVKSLNENIISRRLSQSLLDMILARFSLFFEDYLNQPKEDFVQFLSNNYGGLIPTMLKVLKSIKVISYANLANRFKLDKSTCYRIIRNQCL